MLGFLCPRTSSPLTPTIHPMKQYRTAVTPTSLAQARRAAPAIIQNWRPRSFASHKQVLMSSPNSIVNIIKLHACLSICRRRRKERTPHIAAPPPTFAYKDDAFHINLLPNEHQQLTQLSISLPHQSTLSSEATSSALPSDSRLPNNSFPMRYVMSELTNATVV